MMKPRRPHPPPRTWTTCSFSTRYRRSGMRVRNICMACEKLSLCSKASVGLPGCCRTSNPCGVRRRLPGHTHPLFQQEAASIDKGYVLTVIRRPNAARPLSIGFAICQESWERKADRSPRRPNDPPVRPCPPLGFDAVVQRQSNILLAARHVRAVGGRLANRYRSKTRRGDFAREQHGRN